MGDSWRLYQDTIFGRFNFSRTNKGTHKTRVNFNLDPNSWIIRRCDLNDSLNVNDYRTSDSTTSCGNLGA